MTAEGVGVGTAGWLQGLLHTNAATPPPVHPKEGNLPTTERNLKSCTQDYQEKLHAASTQRVRTTFTINKASLNSLTNSQRQFGEFEMVSEPLLCWFAVFLYGEWAWLQFPVSSHKRQSLARCRALRI